MGKVALRKASQVPTSVAQHREIRALSPTLVRAQITLDVDCIFRASLPFHGRRKSNDFQELFPMYISIYIPFLASVRVILLLSPYLLFLEFPEDSQDP